MTNEQSKPDLREAIRALATEARAEAGDHPSPDVLLRYARGALNEQESDRLQDHLAVCPECTRHLLDLRTFPAVEPIEPERQLSELERERQKRHLDARIQRMRARTLGWVAAGGWAAAAAAVAILVLLPQDGARHLVNVQSVPLNPVGTSTERSTEKPRRIARGDGDLLLTLNLGETTQGTDYSLSIADERGETRTLSEELRRHSNGTFTVLIPRDLLDDGRYKLEIRTIESSESSASLIATYDFVLY